LQRSSVLVEVLVRYFDDNVIFFRIHSIHPAGPAAAAVFIPLTHQLAKRNVNTIPPLGLSSTLMPPRWALSITTANSIRSCKNCCIHFWRRIFVQKT
jgi:hypothetical protein